MYFPTVGFLSELDAQIKIWKLGKEEQIQHTTKLCFILLKQLEDSGFLYVASLILFHLRHSRKVQVRNAQVILPTVYQNVSLYVI